MIKLSLLATTALYESLQESGVDPDKGLRLKQAKDLLTLDLDSPNESDSVIRYEGAVLLIIDPDVEAEFGNCIIDVDLSGDEPGLVIRGNVRV